MNDVKDWKAQAMEDREIWNGNAGFWDDYMKEGNDFQRVLVNPAVMQLLKIQTGERVLEAACGNGNFARILAREGARVTAFDFSEVFIERAKMRSAGITPPIDYHVIDATNEEQLLQLGQSLFDAAVCNMGLMDIANISVLARTLPLLMKSGGRFVFSVSHPCFNTTEVTHMIEESDVGGELVTTYSLKISGYLTTVPKKGLGVVGQPKPHRYYDRPLHVLLGEFFAAGWVMDGLLEPAFPAGSHGKRPTSWDHYPEFPPVLAVRLRVQ